MSDKEDFQVTNKLNFESINQSKGGIVEKENLMSNYSTIANKQFNSDQKQSQPSLSNKESFFKLVGGEGNSCFGDVLSSSDLSATTSISKSISKCDIANLENKIKQLENQITNIKDKH